jgi:serine/threonine protein kinase
MTAPLDATTLPGTLSMTVPLDATTLIASPARCPPFYSSFDASVCLPQAAYAAVGDNSASASQCSAVAAAVDQTRSESASITTTLTTITTGKLDFKTGEEFVFAQLRDLCADRDYITDELWQAFDRVDSESQGHVLRDDAAKILNGVFTSQLPGLMGVRLDDGRWKSILKGAGAYGVHDVIRFAALLEIYIQTLTTLRDCFAPVEFLRSEQRVARGFPRLKDRFDHFEFRSKDVLGKLYSCRDMKTKEARSCRQIRKDKASTPISHIRHRLTQIAALRHPGLPQLHEFLEDYHNLYLVASLPEGVEIMDHIQESYTRAQPLSETWVALVMKQLLEVISYCHSHPGGPIMHRHLTPENVLLSEVRKEGSPIPCISITSFGLQELFDINVLANVLPIACMSDAASQQAVPSYTMPEFSAPEVWKRDNYGCRCDIWSCGCLLFLLLTGELPFGPRLAVQELMAVISVRDPDWQLFRNVSTSALSLCRRMLSRDESVRPSAQECLRHPWLGSLGASGRWKELRIETVGSLMQFHADAKFQQVLMNIVAAELKVRDMRRVATVFMKLDARSTGLLTPKELASAFAELGVTPQSATQVLQALPVDRSGKVPYCTFIAGCLDLVEDKLDHMLWKVFSMVDEDHSGEVGIIEIEHFLSAVCNNGEAQQGKPPTPTRGSATSDVEKYLRGVLDPDICAEEVVDLTAGGRNVVTFEGLKRYLLEGAERHLCRRG